MRRSTFTDVAVTYGAVGGTQAADLLGYPPRGYKPSESAVRLGSGAQRYDIALRQLMTWGVQRASRITVSDVQEGTGEQYAGIRFDDDGTPLGPSDQQPRERTYADDGTPFITNGITARLHVRWGLFATTARVRVVVVVDEDRRAGFAYGTLPGHPLSGEESFILEHRPDNSVWLVVRSLSRPATWYYRLGAPLLRLAQRRIGRRYLRALLPARNA